MEREKFRIPRSVQDAIPIRRIFADVIFQVGNQYPKTWSFTDINYAIASKEDKTSMFLDYSELLNALDSGASAKITIYNRRINKACLLYTSNIPVLNQILSKNQLEQLLDGEHFEPIEFEDEGMKKYLEIYQSQNWMLIGGKLLSKKLALWFTMNRFRNHTSLKVLYLNGMTAKAKVDLDIRGDRYTEFTACLLYTSSFSQNTMYAISPLQTEWTA